MEKYKQCIIQVRVTQEFKDEIDKATEELEISTSKLLRSTLRLAIANFKRKKGLVDNDISGADLSIDDYNLIQETISDSPISASILNQNIEKENDLRQKDWNVLDHGQRREIIIEFRKRKRGDEYNENLEPYFKFVENAGV